MSDLPPKRAQLAFRAPLDLRRALIACARAEGRSMSDVIVRDLTAAMRRKGYLTAKETKR